MPPLTQESSGIMAHKGQGDEVAGCPRLGASSCEQPTMDAGCPRLGASSLEQPFATTPDLFPAVGEDPEADFYEPHWSCGTEGDYALNDDDVSPSMNKYE